MEKVVCFGRDESRESQLTHAAGLRRPKSDQRDMRTGEGGREGERGRERERERERECGGPGAGAFHTLSGLAA